MSHWSESVDAAAAVLLERLGVAPATAVILGSGQSNAARMLTGTGAVRELPFREMPGIPVPSVEGHGGTVFCGNGLVVATGRSHLYEGHPAETVVRLVRSIARWGVRTIVLTNASGSLTPDCKPGRIVLIEDHINLSGENPLTGPHRDGWGERFPDMGSVYDARLQKAARRAARRLKIPFRSGVYIQVPGPSYETPAEVRAFARLGADIVGMSTAIEAIAARHLGLRILGLSIVTNFAGGRGSKLSHEEVVSRAAAAEKNLVALIEETLRVEKLPPRSPDRERP